MPQPSSSSVGPTSPRAGQLNEPSRPMCSSSWPAMSSRTQWRSLPRFSTAPPRGGAPSEPAGPMVGRKPALSVAINTGIFLQILVDSLQAIAYKHGPGWPPPALVLGGQVTSAGGPVQITGTGGNNGSCAGSGSCSNNASVLVQLGSQVLATGATNITLDGIGGSGTVNNFGVLVNPSPTLVQTATGNDPTGPSVHKRLTFQ